MKDLDLLSSGSHYDPHRFLGAHGQEIRLWRPGASQIHLEVLGAILEARKIGDEGLFTHRSKQKIGPLDYRIYHQNGMLAHDPYVFLPVTGDVDAFLFNKGCHYELYKILGAKIKTIRAGRKIRKY